MKNHLMFKIENGKLYSAPKSKEERVNAGNCPFCGEPVYISSGQLMKYYKDQPTHKECRKGLLILNDEY